ncbi:unnamed protein product, partial [Phaeothamnion confervicola]
LDRFQQELRSVVYPRDLLVWAKEKRGELLKLERKLAGLLSDPKATSVSLRPMPREQRRMVHMLADLYGFATVAYDPEPWRYISVIKQKVHAEKV